MKYNLIDKNNTYVFAIDRGYILVDILGIN